MTCALIGRLTVAASFRDPQGRLAADGIHVVPHPDEQAIIREALELKAAGLSLRTIGARLAAGGLLPRQGRAWHPKTVRDLLQAEVVQMATPMDLWPDLAARTARFLADNPSPETMETLMVEPFEKPT